MFDCYIVHCHFVLHNRSMLRWRKSNIIYLIHKQQDATYENKITPYDLTTLRISLKRSLLATLTLVNNRRRFATVQITPLSQSGAEITAIQTAFINLKRICV
jgi:hypothetical protein